MSTCPNYRVYRRLAWFFAALVFAGALPLTPDLAAQGASADLVAAGLEVTQGIQNLNPGSYVRLVANKRTFVRFHVFATGSEAATTAVLRVTSGANIAALLPLNPAGEIRVPANPNRGDLDQSFLFELPDGFKSGTIALEAEVNPKTASRDRNPVETDYTNNLSRIAALNFEVVPPLNLVVYNLGYRMDGVVYYAPDKDPRMLVDWIKRAWPVSEVRVRYLKDFLETGGRLPDCEQVNEFLLSKRAIDLQNTDNPTPVETRYYGMVDSGGGFMRGCANGLPGFASSGPTGVPSPTGSFAWDTDGSYGDWYGAHEVAHTMGRYHAEFCDAQAGLPYPYGNAKISPSASGAGAIYGFDISTLAVYGPDWTDNMAYCEKQWVSDFTYHGIMDAIKTNLVPEPGFLSSEDRIAADTRQDRLLILGHIMPAAGSTPAVVDLEPIFTVPNSKDVTSPQSGDYTIVLRNSAGAEIQRYGFKPDAIVEEGNIQTGQKATLGVLGIYELVPFVDGIAKVEIAGPAGVLGSISAGPAAPKVTVTSPAGGASPLNSDGSVTVAWTASDADKDPLIFNVEYSADNGKTWELVDAFISDTNSVDVDPSDLRPGSQALFRVSASDGIHTGSATSGVFVVPNQEPDVRIVEPLGSATYVFGQTVGLEGTAYDPDSGTIPQESLEWKSDRDGVLGKGDSVSTARLSLGVHKITFTANDGHGGILSDSVQITIIDKAPAQAATLYFPRLVNRSPDFTGIAVANPGNANAQVTFQAFSDAGLPLASATTNPSTLGMKPKTQVANIASEIFGSGLDTAGSWMKVTSNVPGLAGFFLVFDEKLQVMDGADVTDQLLTNFIIGELQGADVSLANPNAAKSSDVTFSLMGNDGKVIGAAKGASIPANGRFSSPLAGIYDAAQLNGAGYLIVNATQGLAATELFGQTGKYIAALNPFDVSGGAKLLYSPQYVVQAGVWKSTLTILNLEDAATALTLDLIGDNGTALAKTSVFNLPAKGRLVISDPAALGISVTGAVVQGYVRITSSNTRVSGYVRYGDPADAQFQTALPFVAQGQKNVVFSQVAQNAQFFTGLAVINHNAAPASITVAAFDTSGVEVGSGQVTIPANGRISKVLTQIIPKLPAMSKGYFTVKSDRAVSSFALFGTQNLSVLAAVPAQALNVP